MKQTIIIEDENLNSNGPLIDVFISVPDGQFIDTHGIAHAFSNLEGPIEPIRVKALIDTGASDCCIAEDIAQKLGLIDLDEQEGTNIFGTKQLSKTCPVSIRIPAKPDDIILNGAIPKLPLLEKEFSCVIGRNVLMSCTFMYYGKENKFVLEFG